jgi:hypothetical protein
MNFEVPQLFQHLAFLFPSIFIPPGKETRPSAARKRVADELRIAVPRMSEELGQCAPIDL